MAAGYRKARRLLEVGFDSLALHHLPPRAALEDDDGNPISAQHIPNVPKVREAHYALPVHMVLRLFGVSVMTAANEKPDCPHKHTGSCSPDGVYLYVRCMDCWEILMMSDEGRRRLSECQGYEPPKKEFGRHCIHCDFDFWDHKRRAQTAAGVDDAEYTQGFAYDGVVILKDGQPITIDEVLAMLNARARGG